MQNQRVAELLGQIADLLEIQGESLFRVAAYREAARHVEGLTEPIEAVDERGELTEIPGIGASIAAKISEFLGSGRLAYLAELPQKVPAGVATLIRVPGLGPRRALQIYEELGVETVPDLQQAAKEHRLRALRGFGEKHEQNILRSLAARPAASERRLLTQALPAAEAIVAALRGVPQALQVEIAGSLRRFKETIGDLDLLVAAREPEPVTTAFVEFPAVQRVIARGATKSSVLLDDGLQADLRVVKPEAYGAALVYFTGSKAHNIKLRHWAERKGLKISEYGVFRARTGKRLGGQSEEEVYGALGLPWIPPELREDSGELEAARDGRLPALVQLEQIRGDLQSRASDGQGSLEEMAEAAAARGYGYLAITDHSQGLGIARGLNSEKLRQQHAEIDALNRRLKGIRLLRGIEVNIRRDGTLDASDDDLAACDVVVASLHSGLDQDGRRLTSRILRAIEHPHVHIIGHPTGRSIGRRPAADLDLHAIADAAARTETALEINSMPDRLDLCDAHARLAIERGAPIVISTDAHSPAQLELMRLGAATARRGWVPPERVWNTLPLAELRRRLAGRRERRAAAA